MTYEQVSVTDSATLIKSASGSHANFPRSVTIHNPDASAVFLGVSSSVTAAATAGMELISDGYLTIPLYPGDSLYGIVASGTADVEVLTHG